MNDDIPTHDPASQGSASEEERVPERPVRVPEGLAVTVELTLRAEAGDDEAFTELYRRHYDRVRRSAALRMGKLLKQCEQDIDDVVQDAFADVFQRLREGRLNRIHTEGALRRYMATVVLNMIRNRARRRPHQLFMCDIAQHTSFLECLAGKGPRPSQDAHGAELEERIEAAILELESPYRDAIDLVFHCGMRSAEIAEQGLITRPSDGDVYRTAEAVRLILHRARRKLADILKPESNP